MFKCAIRCLIESSRFRIQNQLTLKQSTVDVGLKIGSTHSCDEDSVEDPVVSVGGPSKGVFETFEA